MLDQAPERLDDETRRIKGFKPNNINISKLSEGVQTRVDNFMRELASIQNQNQNAEFTPDQLNDLAAKYNFVANFAEDKNSATVSVDLDGEKAEVGNITLAGDLIISN
jgi:hypothetical protein